MNTHRHFDAEIEVLSPVHIGDGQSYIRDYDYVVSRGSTWMLDKQKYFDWAVPDVDNVDEATLLGKPADVIPLQKIADMPFVRYRMIGEPEKSELASHIKTPYGEVYIPGSSIKGMLRTCFIWGIHELNEKKPDLKRLGRSRSWAGQAIERDIMGRNPNYDLFRAMLVADTEPAGLDALRVTGTQIYPTNKKGNQGVIVDAEVIREGTKFLTRISFDRYGFQNEEAARTLSWQNKEELLQYFVLFPREFARTRLKQEREYYRQRADDEIKPVYGFYRHLVEEFSKLKENQFIAQIGRGTGWNSKTLNALLLSDEQQFAELVRNYRLRGHLSNKFEAGMRFPSSRTLVRREGRFVLPMGWVKVTVG